MYGKGESLNSQVLWVLGHEKGGAKTMSRAGASQGAEAEAGARGGGGEGAEGGKGY